MMEPIERTRKRLSVLRTLRALAWCLTPTLLLGIGMGIVEQATHENPLRGLVPIFLTPIVVLWLWGWWSFDDEGNPVWLGSNSTQEQHPSIEDRSGEPVAVCQRATSGGNRLRLNWTFFGALMALYMCLALLNTTWTWGALVPIIIAMILSRARTRHLQLISFEASLVLQLAGVALATSSPALIRYVPAAGVLSVTSVLAVATLLSIGRAGGQPKSEAEQT